MAEKDVKKQDKGRIIPLRQAGVTVNDVRERPSKILFEEVLKQEQIAANNIDNTHPTPPTPPTSPIAIKKVNSGRKKAADSIQSKFIDTSPIKDYQKVANSIVRETIPTGAFIGKSKLIYDCLYLLTRGAVMPKRSVRITKKNLMNKAGIGSERTLLKNLSHLKIIGLVEISEFEGQHEGNEYEVFVPEEIGSKPHPPHPPHPRYPLQKVGTLPTAESGVGGVGLIVEKTDSYSYPKTFFKDYLNIDDEAALTETINLLDKAAKIATGKGLTAKDFEALKEIIEIIISETEIARKRTKFVSVYLKLAAENLRRRLYTSKIEPNDKSIPSNKSWIKVGKNQSEADSYDEEGNYIPKPLDKTGRKEALETLREYQSWGASIKESERFYTVEDWRWLIKNLSVIEGI